VEAVDLRPLSVTSADTPLGTNADAWFMALDGRRVRVGSDTGVLHVQGIHTAGVTLWIQVSLFGESMPGIVLKVNGAQSAQDVFTTLDSCALTGVPLQIVCVQPIRTH
jgi:hypothetical protein